MLPTDPSNMATTLSTVPPVKVSNAHLIAVYVLCGSIGTCAACFIPVVCYVRRIRRNRQLQDLRTQNLYTEGEVKCPVYEDMDKDLNCADVDNSDDGTGFSPYVDMFGVPSGLAHPPTDEAEATEFEVTKGILKLTVNGGSNSLDVANKDLQYQNSSSQYCLSAEKHGQM